MAPPKKIEAQIDNRVGEIKPKRRRVAFAMDPGTDANECMHLHLVSSLQEMQDVKGLEDEGVSFHPDYMQQFVGEDCKIYGYRGLKIDVWLNALSFHAYVEINYESKVEDGKSEKKPTDLTALMKKIFGQGLMEDCDTFLQTFSSDNQKIENLIFNSGEFISSHGIATNKTLSLQGDSGRSGLVASDKIVRLEFTDRGIREWHTRLAPLVLLLVEGSQPIEQDDIKWEIYVSIQKDSINEGDTRHKLLGFCIVYRFYHYPDSTRLRISQVLVFPPYQGRRHGLHMLEAVNQVAVQRDCYDVTVEEPSESLQELRDCMDTIRLVSFDEVGTAIKSAVEKLKTAKLSDNLNADSLEENEKSDATSVSRRKSKQRSCWFPHSELVEEVRKHMKINKKQLKHCWEILLFLNLDRSDSRCQENYQVFLMEQIMSELFDKSSEKSARGKQVIDIDNGDNSSKIFIMVRTNGDTDNSSSHLPQAIEDENEAESREEQLKAVFEERLEEIANVAEKVSAHCKTFGIAMP